LSVAFGVSETSGVSVVIGLCSIAKSAPPSR
jgi:hypothetical protein